MIIIGYNSIININQVKNYFVDFKHINLWKLYLKHINQIE